MPVVAGNAVYPEGLIEKLQEKGSENCRGGRLVLSGTGGILQGG